MTSRARDSDAMLSTFPELLIKRSTGPFLYQTSIGYAAKPKADRFQHAFVSAEICNSRLGFNSLHLTCASIKDYFYCLNRNRSTKNQGTFYDVVKTRPNVSLGELKLAYKLLELELLAAGAHPSQRAALARAFNVLSIPELRACYDALLNDPKSRPCSPLPDSVYSWSQVLRSTTVSLLDRSLPLFLSGRNDVSSCPYGK
jgi:hypothetical protein